jgi:hypothetical protein
MTDAMLEALGRLKDGPLESTKHFGWRETGRGVQTLDTACIADQTAKALRRRGFAKPVGFNPTKYEITAAGLEAYTEAMGARDDR